jgi:hypothetical protein
MGEIAPPFLFICAIYNIENTLNGYHTERDFFVFSREHILHVPGAAELQEEGMCVGGAGGEGGGCNLGLSRRRRRRSVEHFNDPENVCEKKKS